MQTLLPPHINNFPVNDDEALAVSANRVLARVVETADGCLEFTGRVDPSTGYGRIKLSGVNTYTHRVMAARFLGDVDGKHVHHRCHNRQCCNPNHLEILSASDHAKLTAKERA